MTSREENGRPRPSYLANDARRREERPRDRTDPTNSLNVRILRCAQTHTGSTLSSLRFSPADRQSYRTADRDSVSEKLSTQSTLTFPEPLAMNSAVRLIDDADSMDFLDFCKEYLMDSNRGFTVIGAVGGQSVGKSTILSMLAENEPGDMYRQYVFRPYYREGMANNRHQTTKIHIYINRWRTIFLDCQPIASRMLLSDFLSSHRRLSKEQATDQFELMSLQLLTLMTRVCDTLLLCIDNFIDMTVVGDLLQTELFREKAVDLPDRKVNLVVLHQRARPADLEPLVVLARMRTLAGVFVESAFDVVGGVNLATLGFARYRPLADRSAISYVPFGELPPSKFVRANTGGIGATNGYGSGLIRTSAKFQEKMGLDSEDYSIGGDVTYRRVVHALRTKLFTLPRRNGDVTEIEWFNNASRMWDRIRNELKIGFTDSFWRCKYPLKSRSNNDRVDEEALDEDAGAKSSQDERLARHPAAAIRSPAVRRGRNPDVPYRSLPRYTRNFCVDERDQAETSGRSVGDDVDPRVIRIITKRSTNNSKICSGEESPDDGETTEENSEEEVGSQLFAATNSPPMDSDNGQGCSSPDCDPPTNRRPNNQRTSEAQTSSYMLASRPQRAGKSLRSTNFRPNRNIDSEEYEAIKKKIFSSIETTTIADEMPKEDRFRPKQVLKHSAAPEETNAEEKDDIASLHAASCSQELSDI